MKEKNIEGTVESRVCFQELEDWVREKVQSWVQELLEEEVTELLERDKSERRGRVDPASGYRNGYGKKRRLTLSSGTITVRRPRVRDLEERFESRVLPLFAKRTQQVRDLIPELYLHGLAQGDFDLALRGLWGIHLTGPIRAGSSPGAVRWRALQARRVPARLGRRGRHRPGPLGGDKILVAVSDHRKTYFFGLSPTGHRSRQPRLWRGIGGNGSVQRLNRPQIEHRQRVGERRGAGELIVPPP